MTYLLFLSINRPDLWPLTFTLAGFVDTSPWQPPPPTVCLYFRWLDLSFDLGFVDMSPWQPPPPQRNEMYILGHAPLLNQPIRGLDSWQVMINRFALSFLCIDLDRNEMLEVTGLYILLFTYGARPPLGFYFVTILFLVILEIWHCCIFINALQTEIWGLQVKNRPYSRRGNDGQKERLGLQIFRKCARQYVNCDVTSLLLHVHVT